MDATMEENQRAGICSFLPSTTVSLVIAFACLIAATVVPYLRAIPPSVSPFTTTCTVPPAGILAGGKAEDGPEAAGFEGFDDPGSTKAVSGVGAEGEVFSS